MQSLNKVDFSKSLGVNFLPNSNSSGPSPSTGPAISNFPILGDPKEFNKNLQVTFDTIIGEPGGDLQSPSWTQIASSKIFLWVQICLYKFLAIILAPILSLLIAIIFTLLTFAQIWLARPILKFFHIIFGTIRTFLEIVLNGLFGPAFEVAGLCCSQAKLRHQKILHQKEEPQFPFII